MARAPSAVLATLLLLATSPAALAQDAPAPSADPAPAQPAPGAAPAASADDDTASESEADDGSEAEPAAAPAAPPPAEAPAEPAPADAPPAAEEPTAEEPLAEEDPLLADDGEDPLLVDDGEDDDFLDLNVTQSDEPSILERQIVAIVASGVTVVALIAGATFGTLSYLQYQCAADVIACNEVLDEPIIGDQLFEARANVEQLALLADMAYLFAAASALVAITGFVRGFIFTGAGDDEDTTEATFDDSNLDDSNLDEAPADGNDAPAGDDAPAPAEGAAAPTASPTASASGLPGRTVGRSLTPARAVRGSLFFEVE